MKKFLVLFILVPIVLSAQITGSAIKGKTATGEFVFIKTDPSGNLYATPVGTIPITIGNATLPVTISNHYLTIIDWSHHEIHEGDSYYGEVIATSVGNNGVVSFLIDTKNIVLPEEVHFMFGFQTTKTTTIETFEGVSVSASGTTMDFWNRERSLPKSTGVIGWRNPTVTSTGTKLRTRYIGGSGRTTGQERDVAEIILKPNTLYLIRAKSGEAADDICLYADFYVHANDD